MYHRGKRYVVYDIMFVNRTASLITFALSSIAFCRALLNIKRQDIFAFHIFLKPEWMKKYEILQMKFPVFAQVIRAKGKLL